MHHMHTHALCITQQDKSQWCIHVLTPCIHADLVKIVDMCLTSFVVWAFRIRSRQMGHISSLCSARGDIAILVVSETISCGLRWSS